MVIYTTSLGLCHYRRVLQIQYAVHAHCVKTGDNVLLLTEHLPVVTLGRHRARDQLRLSATLLAERGIEVIETERGGGATYHGPGQLVVYPIFSSLLRRYNVRRFVADLEEVMCRVSRNCGVPAARRPELPGAWVETRKIGAVGITLRRGVSLHGCALNVNLDLQPFSYIIPCGLSDVEVTSVRQETGETLLMSAVEERVRQEFACVFAATLQEMPNEWCGAEREARASTVDYHQPS